MKIIPQPTDKAHRLALRMRENPNRSELRLRRELAERWGFRYSVAFGPYIADFLSERLGVIVEVDGPHHERQREYDAKRDAFAAEHGFATVRIPTSLLWRDVGAAVERVADAIGDHAPRGRRTKKKAARREKKRIAASSTPRRDKLRRKRARRRARERGGQRVFECIPDVFKSKDVARALKKVKPPSKKQREVAPSVDTRRPGGVYRKWQPPAPLPPLDL